MEYSNKILVTIIKKLQLENKKAWHTKLIFALWDDKISTNRPLGLSPFELVYGRDAIFHTSFGILVMNLIQ